MSNPLRNIPVRYYNLVHCQLQSLTEKQAKELREMKGGRNLLDNLNDRFVLCLPTLANIIFMSTI